MRLLALAVAVFISGCATVMAGGPDKIPVNSNPPGASVFVDGVLVGQTPMVVTLDRERSQGQIQIQAPGFAPMLIQRDKEINGWFWGNLCLGIVPLVIDLVTGDYKRFDDMPIAVGLTPGGGAGYAPPMGGQPYPQGPPPYPQGPPPQPYPQGPPPPQPGPNTPPPGY